VEASFRRRARRLRAAATRIRDEGDAEAVHDLRVTIRRLSMLLWLWKPLIRTPGIRRRLRRLRRGLGPARETEVHLVLVRRLRLAPSEPGRTARAALIQDLDRQRRRMRHAAARRVARLEIGRWLERAAGKLGPGVGHPGFVVEPGVRLERLRSRALATLLAARDANDLESFHRARVALKRWRYAQEIVEEVLGRGPETGLAELQETLGVVHDLAMLEAYLKSSGSGPEGPRLAFTSHVTRRLDLRRVAAARAIARWLERRGEPAPLDAPSPLPGGYRRTTRSGGGAPAPAIRPRGVRSLRVPETGGS
jgi:CHAD domain-containing protein